MSYAYWKNGHHEDPSVFDCFFRKCPFKGEFTIFAGLDEVLKFVSTWKISEEEVQFVQSMMPNVEPEFLEWLRNADTSQIKIYAIEEGSVVFPKVPLIRVEGPLAVAQLLETTILNLVNFPSLVATNAARHKNAANGVGLMEFGLRRAQGPDGSFTATKYSYVGGFQATSNVLAAMKLGIPCKGTHAHAYISSYISFDDLTNRNLNGEDLVELATSYRDELGYNTNEGELAGFISYALAYPDGFLALVDTYDTMNSGVPNFLCVCLALNKLGYKPVGIRLDSGDLAYLSKQARQEFRRVSEKYSVPFEDLQIVASNDINEKIIHSLNQQGHEINVYGIGTNLVTCQAQPALGMVYKLVEVRGVPRIKLSNEKDKITIPGRKNAYRLYNSKGVGIVDLMNLSSQNAPTPGEKILVQHPFFEHLRAYVTPDSVDPLLVLFYDGCLVKPIPDIHESRARCEKQLTQIREDVIRSRNPTPYKLSVTKELYDFIGELWLKETPIQELDS